MVRYCNPRLTIRDRPFVWGDRTYIMGVLNVTPDSFSDGGEFVSLQNALNQAQHLETSGADILDIGGQSTRPGAEEVSLKTEIQRVVPLIEALRSHSNCPISVDTYRAGVAAAALDAGADIINDVSGGTADPEMLPLIGERQVPAILMHMRGTPKTMQSLTEYEDVVAEVAQKLQQHIHAAIACGVSPNQLILDPGIGFAKTQEQNLHLLRQLPRFHSLGYPLLLGVSRKSFIGRILDRPEPKDRLWGTAAACTAAIASGADILRVHDLPAMSDVARVADVLVRPHSTL
ncbi:dihydropteroate synthase [Phormidium yuhuli AB48]|uniref:Dihydropteroate synthase n=1 Tax=Phormidium yuhuli AB48 TaxID=2940671 RepID=A0ABY5ARL3_9CYAN|nr:dihydropteroate synthase [Phormidium yuhuli]USR91546.1 dihydropteroate synthase [Phormidium yuhuli AB48]